MKRDARLRIRIPSELKDKILGIDRVYTVALPKIANECLKAFCAYVKQKKQPPTVPSELAPAIEQLTAFQFARAKEFETVIGKQGESLASQGRANIFRCTCKDRRE
jgi:hypothetical protein